MKARWNSAGFGEPPGSVNAATHFEKSTRYRMVTTRYGVTLRHTSVSGPDTSSETAFLTASILDSGTEESCFID